MTNPKLWERVDQAVANVQTWPDWKKGSSVNSRSEQTSTPVTTLKAKSTDK
jgi:hypothetical protein